jgi:hypothetical protein
MTKIFDTSSSRFSFTERSSIATIGSLVTAFGGYAVVVARNSRLSSNHTSYKALMVIAVVVFAGLMAISHGVLAAASPKSADEFDERDRLIEDASNRPGSFVLASGVCCVLFLALREASYFSIANTLLASWVLSELTTHGLKVIKYYQAR